MLSKTNKKILIVDDKESWRRNYEKILTKEGHYVLSVEKLDDAIRIIEEHFFHAAVIDLRLIDKDENNEQGMNILEILHQTGEMTGLIVISGFPNSDRVKRAYANYNVVDFIEKDEFEAELLIADIEKAIMQSESYIKNEENHLIQFAQRELENRTGHIPNNELVSLFESLVKPLLPLAHSDEALESNTNAKLIFSSVYWSRFLGKKIILQIGNRKTISEKSEHLREQGRDVFIATRQGISGLRYVIDDPSPTTIK